MVEFSKKKEVKTSFSFFSLHTNIDGDNINDCFATGPRAQFYTISGKTGRVIWRLNADERGEPFQQNAAFHTPLLLTRDVDNDGLNDLLVMHGGDYQRKTKSASARLVCLSSRQGDISTWSHVPDGQDSYIPPVLFYKSNQKQNLDTVEIIYGTGSYNQPGSLWSINLDEFLQKNTLKNSIKIYKDCCKGIMTPPILIDLNKDHVQDIVIALFNSTVVAFNGRTFVELWHTKFGLNSEFYVQPSVGYFDDDDTPDFLVQYETGDGFPSSYYSQVQVLNGKNGKLMLADSFKMLTGSRSSPITISVDSKSNKNKLQSNNSSDQVATIDSFDLFLFWQITCDNQEQELKRLTKSDQLDQFRYKLKFNSINELRKTDFCKLRFNKNSLSRLNSISYGNIMTTIYDSSERAGKELEQNNRFNYTKIGADFLSKNPELFLNYMNNIDVGDNFMDEESNDDNDRMPFDLSQPNGKRNNNYRDTSFNLNPNGFYLPGSQGLNNDKNDYAFKNGRPNDYSFNQFQQQQQRDKTGNSFSLPTNFDTQSNAQFLENPFNQNNLANLLSQFQQQQQQQKSKLLPPPPPYQNFDLNNFNNLNKNRFVEKKSSSPYDDVPILEELFERRSRTKRNANDETKLIHKIFSTGKCVCYLYLK